MSKGPGSIERAVTDALTAEPDNAFTTEDLCDRVFRGANRIEKKHRVSLIRAAKRVCEKLDAWHYSISEGHGGALVFWNRYSVLSYGAMRAKTDMFAHYRTNDARVAKCWRGTPESIKASLAEGGKYYHHVMEGGAWWRHVQLWAAERDGDNSERIERLKAEQADVERQLAPRHSRK